MDDWLSVTRLSKILEIPETTTRRYLNNFEEYFRWEQIGRGKKYHPGSVEILRRIAMLYDSDRETNEIKRILADEYAFVMEEDVEETTTEPPTYDIPKQFEKFQQKQEDFNERLIEKLHEQQEYLGRILENHEKKMIDVKKLNSSNEERVEQYEKIMLEYKKKERLEKEALNLWKRKPEKEKFKKVGFIRKIEDVEKRDLFIKEFIEENFEKYKKNNY